MVKIENLAKEYSTGKTTIRLQKTTEHEDIDFDLLVEIEDQEKLLQSQQKIESKNSDESDLVEPDKIMKKIIDQSYPNLDDKTREQISLRHSRELLLELHFVWGWKSREAFEAHAEAQKKLRDLLKDGDTQELLKLLAPVSQS